MRIIPAYAGSTPAALPADQPGPDHPRIRGEHVGPQVPQAGFEGSSPHTRGAQRLSGTGRSGPRIIPAYAGSTVPFGPVKRTRRDHPRIRGEHAQGSCATSPSWGSSPHTRGAPPHQPPPVVGGRIIPAYAGSTPTRPDRASWVEDHPRIRGEHVPAELGVGDAGGSSPHTRGARPRPRGALAQARIIPAYAGSTPTCPRRASPSRDHPRIRGEHTTTYERTIEQEGSSPHTRGAPPSRALAACWRGIIPAYAGSTWAGWGRWRICGDHPRIRGEHVHACRAFFLSAGSSPHTRGAPAGQDRQRFRHGIIPAYAGSTPSV